MKFLNQLGHWLISLNPDTPIQPLTKQWPEQWQEEQDFWFTKANRAFIRFNDAYDKGDHEGMEIYRYQHSLYVSRIKALVPDSCRKKWESEKEKEYRAAFEEIQPDS